MYNIHDSTVYLYFFIILANKVACLLHCDRYLSVLAMSCCCHVIDTHWCT